MTIRSTMGRPTVREPDRLRVLCLDEEPAILGLMARLLERLGLVATTVSGPYAALDLFDKNHFDLVITDIRMPAWTVTPSSRRSGLAIRRSR